MLQQLSICPLTPVNSDAKRLTPINSFLTHLSVCNRLIFNVLSVKLTDERYSCLKSVCLLITQHRASPRQGGVGGHGDELRLEAGQGAAFQVEGAHIQNVKRLDIYNIFKQKKRENYEIMSIFAEMKSEKKEVLLSETGKFLIDIAKLIFGGVILAGIMRYDESTPHCCSA